MAKPPLHPDDLESVKQKLRAQSLTTDEIARSLGINTQYAQKLVNHIIAEGGHVVAYSILSI